MLKTSKKKKFNAFYIFMLDFKAKEEKKGRKFPNGIKDVLNDPFCKEAWNCLSQEDKMYYKNKVTNYKKINDKEASVEKSYDQVQIEQLQEKKFLNNMQTNILSILKEANSTKCLQEMKFYVVHVNYFYSSILNNEPVYYPAEIAIAEFSLLKGIIRNFHKIINSEIKLGYSAQATEYSRETHQIPKNPDFGEKDYGLIYKEICEFLEQSKRNGELPPLYTLFSEPNIKYPVIQILNTLANFKENFKQKFTVYSLEELFTNLRNFNIHEFSNILKFNNDITSQKFEHDPFAYDRTIQCEYHQITDQGTYCSKSFVQRWIYVMYPSVCPLFEISLIQGIHLLNNSIECDDLETIFKELILRKIKSNYEKSLKSQISNKSNESHEWSCNSKDRHENGREKCAIKCDSASDEEFSKNSNELLDSSYTTSRVLNWIQMTEECSNNTGDDPKFPCIGRGYDN